ncbi:MAG: hypothetical protein Q9209_002356 [Squamulea sp. 1 TL-2023]
MPWKSKIRNAFHHHSKDKDEPHSSVAFDHQATKNDESGPSNASHHQEKDDDKPDLPRQTMVFEEEHSLFDYTPPYPPDRPPIPGRDPWEKNHEDLQGIPQRPHPLYDRFCNDPNVTHHRGETSSSPKPSDSTSDFDIPIEPKEEEEETIQQSDEDREYEKLVETCKVSKQLNDLLAEWKRMYLDACTRCKDNEYGDVQRHFTNERYKIHKHFGDDVGAYSLNYFDNL